MEWERRSARPASGRVLVVVLLCMFGTLLATYSASANPGIYPDFESRDELLFYLAVTNLPIDLFCFSALLLFLCRECGLKIERMPANSNLFLAAVLVASLVIALSGAIIDFYSFYIEDQSGYSLWWGNSGPVYESPNLYLALVSIFLSVFFVSVIVVRTSGMIGLYIAAGMTAINLAVWLFILSFSGSFTHGPTILLSTVFWFPAVIVLFLLWRWHRTADLKDATTPDKDEDHALKATEGNGS